MELTCSSHDTFILLKGIKGNGGGEGDRACDSSALGQRVTFSGNNTGNKEGIFPLDTREMGLTQI